MKNKEEILNEIKKLKEHTYKLILEEENGTKENTNELATYRYVIVYLEWVLNL
jgi:ribosomal protein L29